MKEFKSIVSNEESDVHKLVDEVKERENIISSLPELKPTKYINTTEFKETIEYGRYLVVRKDGKKHLEIFNGTGWAYNNDSIIAFYLPKIN
jgi:hypothetical protein